ncbi:hypothetical protein HDU97_004445 [Phlyctochytrium planicorne]|nr:hypothetical protein HDU97_004445 [Phlyctochytrium planicorne]
MTEEQFTRTFQNTCAMEEGSVMDYQMSSVMSSSVNLMPPPPMPMPAAEFEVARTGSRRGRPGLKDIAWTRDGESGSRRVQVGIVEKPRVQMIPPTIDVGFLTASHPPPQLSPNTITTATTTATSPTSTCPLVFVPATHTQVTPSSQTYTETTTTWWDLATKPPGTHPRPASRETMTEDGSRPCSPDVNPFLDPKTWRRIPVSVPLPGLERRKTDPELRVMPVLKVDLPGTRLSDEVFGDVVVGDNNPRAAPHGASNVQALTLSGPLLRRPPPRASFPVPVHVFQKTVKRTINIASYDIQLDDLERSTNVTVSSDGEVIDASSSTTQTQDVKQDQTPAIPGDQDLKLARIDTKLSPTTNIEPFSTSTEPFTSPNTIETPSLLSPSLSAAPTFATLSLSRQSTRRLQTTITTECALTALRVRASLLSFTDNQTLTSTNDRRDGVYPSSLFASEAGDGQAVDEEEADEEKSVGEQVRRAVETWQAPVITWRRGHPRPYWAQAWYGRDAGICSGGGKYHGRN